MLSIARMALQDGMEIGSDVVGSTGVIVPKGTKVDRNVVAKLARFDVMVVEIMEPEDYATTHNEKVRLSKDFVKFSEVYHYNLNAYKLLLNQFMNQQHPMNPLLLLDIHNKIAACARSRETLIDYLYNMLPSEDDMTYAHLLNSALIATVFGHWLSLDESSIQTLTLCGFFYDIGKCKLPNRILWKPDKLSDFEFNWMKTHTTIGFDMIKNVNLSQEIKNTTIQHHERCDGSGYPNHLKDDNISFYSKVMAIVDSYEAMTSARTYRTSMNPFQVIANFERTGFEKYGTMIIRPILEHIANEQLGMEVRLSDDRNGSVLLINKDRLSRPLVKLNDETIVDLSKQPDLQITAIF